MLSVVVPVFRNRESLSDLHSRLTQTHAARFPNIGLEIVFVDDGSDDGSMDVLKELAVRDSRVAVVQLSRNFGQLNAILAGLNRASGDGVVVISADLQDPPELVGDMVDRWCAGNEVVVAYRVSRDDGVGAKWFSRVAYGVARRAIPQMPEGGFDFVLMSRRAVDLMLSFKGHHRFFQGDVLWSGLDTALIPYQRERRPHGKSGWTFGKKFKYFTDLILDSSYWPIQFMSRAGVFVASLGVLYSIVIVVAWLVNRTPFSGWAPLMITQLVVGGMIMVMLGVIGEYLWRIYDDIRERPDFVVKATIANEVAHSESSGN